MNKFPNRLLGAIVIAIMMGVVTACGGGGGSSETSSGDNAVVLEDFVGTWLITKEDTTSFWIFNQDGTFQKKRAGQPLNSPNHFVGTYSVNEGILQGEFTNPGVGDGEIQGTINENDVFLMDFIEFWHSPPKVVPCTGTRQ